MAGTNINRVVMTGNLTKDPDVKGFGNGNTLCKLRIACNTRRKNSETGQWEEKPNYFDVTVWGAQGENCGRYLSRGRPVAIDGRLEWREWEQDGVKRQAVDIIADSVQFLGSPSEGGGGNGNGYSVSRVASESDAPADMGDFDRAPVASGGDDDIPF